MVIATVVHYLSGSKDGEREWARRAVAFARQGNGKAAKCTRYVKTPRMLSIDAIQSGQGKCNEGLKLHLLWTISLPHPILWYRGVLSIARPVRLRLVASRWRTVSRDTRVRVAVVLRY